MTLEQKYDAQGRRMYPLVDPKTCSIEDLENILETDPIASYAYQRELNKRRNMEQESEQWETSFDK